jgi:Enolase C-terminal domain-like
MKARLLEVPLAALFGQVRRSAPISAAAASLPTTTPRPGRSKPVSSDDRDGLREVRDGCGADVAARGYGYSLGYFASMVVAAAVDWLQIDVTRCGGYTVWLRGAAIAQAHNLPDAHKFRAD